MPEKKTKSKVTEPIEESKVGKSRREKLSNYLIDISKYVMTGVVIASLVKDLDDNRPLIYVCGLLIALSALCTLNKFPGVPEGKINKVSTGEVNRKRI